MTIAVGFRFNGGVVLCADTQETVGTYKASVPKLLVEPNQQLGKDTPDDLMIAVAGAGDAAFIDKLVERIWLELSITTGFDQACEEAEKAIKSTHEEFGKIFQAGEMPRVEFVYGVKMHGKSKLFFAQGPIVNEKSGYYAVGVGNYLANFLASRMEGKILEPYQALLLVAYVIFQCKEHVDGCGGETHIAALLEKGKSLMFDSDVVGFATHHARAIDSLVREGILKIPYFSLQSGEFNTELGMLGEDLYALLNRRRDLDREFKDLITRISGWGEGAP